jgi:hypothetical protein
MKMILIIVIIIIRIMIILRIMIRIMIILRTMIRRLLMIITIIMLVISSHKSSFFESHHVNIRFGSRFGSESRFGTGFGV